MLGFIGPGLLVAKASQGSLSLWTLASDTLTVLEPYLFGAPLDAQCLAEKLTLMGHPRLKTLQITGRGPVAIRTARSPVSLPIGDEGLVLRAEHVVGWVGRVTALPLDPAEAPYRARGFLRFVGQGWVLLI